MLISACLCFKRLVPNVVPKTIHNEGAKVAYPLPSLVSTRTDYEMQLIDFLEKESSVENMHDSCQRQTSNKVYFLSKHCSLLYIYLFTLVFGSSEKVGVFG